MTISIETLAAAVDPARSMLLLGAGASVASGGPTAAELSAGLAARFEPGLGSHQLNVLAEILESKVGRRPIVDWIRERFESLIPRGGILSIPHHPWKEIYTTNYDTLVEKAYQSAHRPYTPIRSNFDLPNVANADTLIFKIHGCVTQDRSLGSQASMLITQEDIDNHQTHREHLWDRLKGQLSTYKLLIVGQSLADEHLREIVQRAAAIQSKIGVVDAVHLLVYSRDENLALLWEKRGIKVAFGGIDEFFNALGARRAAVRAEPPTARSVDAYAFPFPTELLPSTIPVVVAATDPSKPAALFSGRAAWYSDIRRGITFERDLEAQLSHRFNDDADAICACVAGAAGVGKTTLVRRVAHTLAQNGALAWEHQSRFVLNAEKWLDVAADLAAQNKRGVLVLDEVTKNQRQANVLLDGLRSRGLHSLFVIATTENSQWAPRVKSREFFREGVLLKLGTLSATEINRLIALLQTSGDVAALQSPTFAAMSLDDKRRHLRRRCSSDMFVCLKNIFGYESIDEILLGEYKSLHEEEQLIYRDVAALESAGVEVHRQLVIRMLNVSTNFLAKLLESLEGIIEESDKSAERGLYVWSTRHPLIANTITKYKYAEQGEHLAFIEKVIDSINPSIGLELRSISELCNSEFGVKRIRDQSARIRLYEKLIDLAPTERIPRHRLVREMIDSGDLSSAEVALQEAVDVVRLDAPLHRYKIRLLCARARTSDKLAHDDKLALLRRAREEALWGVERYGAQNMHSYFALDDVAHDYFELTGERGWVEESIEKMRMAEAELLDPEIGDRIRRSLRALGG